MSPTGVTLMAVAGVHAYVALYYTALYTLRRQQREYRLFASFCVCLGVYAFGSAWTMDAIGPADSIDAQHLQMVGLLPSLAFFVDFMQHFLETPQPRFRQAAYVCSFLGAAAAGAGLFFDPAFADPLYDWSNGSPTNPAFAELTPIGRTFLLVGSGFSGYVTIQLFATARGRSDVRVAAAATGIAIAGGLYDFGATIFDLTTLHLGAHLTLLPVMTLCYVLIGRLTSVDAQLELRTGELAASYDHLRQTQQEIVKTEQLAAVGELSAVIAHEVRNPLAILKNAVSGLRRPEIGEADADTLLEILDTETDRLNRLVNDLLAYAKPISPEAGAHVDLEALVAHAVQLAAAGRPDIEKIEIELKLDGGGADGAGTKIDKVEGDEALLRHALINIADNALQAMPSGGTLTVSCRNTDLGGRPCVAVDFHDTGEGMDTLVRSRARDPFFTTRQSGTGLGLAIVERVARAHGGSVELASRHGQGTTVSLLIPRERSSLAPAAS